MNASDDCVCDVKVEILINESDRREREWSRIVERGRKRARPKQNLQVNKLRMSLRRYQLIYASKN